MRRFLPVAFALVVGVAVGWVIGRRTAGSSDSPFGYSAYGEMPKQAVIQRPDGKGGEGRITTRFKLKRTSFPNSKSVAYVPLKYNEKGDLLDDQDDWVVTIGGHTYLIVPE